MTSVLILVNGPNLGLLGHRQPEIYGTQTLADIEGEVTAKLAGTGVQLVTFQSDHEGELVAFFGQKFLALKNRTIEISGIIINPGAYTHTSIALRDALENLTSVGIPLVEVHLSNVFARESFRHHSFISPIALGVITGLGAFGYIAAVSKILELQAKGS